MSRISVCMLCVTLKQFQSKIGIQNSIPMEHSSPYFMQTGSLHILCLLLVHYNDPQHHIMMSNAICGKVYDMESDIFRRLSSTNLFGIFTIINLHTDIHIVYMRLLGSLCLCAFRLFIFDIN